MNGEEWSKRDLAFLRYNYIELGPEDCAKKLGRTAEACRTKAARLGCNTKRGEYVANELDGVLGRIGGDLSLVEARRKPTIKESVIVPVEPEKPVSKPTTSLIRCKACNIQKAAGMYHKNNRYECKKCVNTKKRATENERRKDIGKSVSVEEATKRALSKPWGKMAEVITKRDYLDKCA